MTYNCSVCTFSELPINASPCSECVNGLGDPDAHNYWKAKESDLFSEDLVTIENEQGGKQSKIPGRYDLLPPIALGEIAVVLGEGAEKYGEWNWLGISTLSHLNHAIRHLVAYLHNRNFADLTHAGCRIMFAIHQHREESREN